jgi:hypothetical protein
MQCGATLAVREHDAHTFSVSHVTRAQIDNCSLYGVWGYKETATGLTTVLSVVSSLYEIV